MLKKVAVDKNIFWISGDIGVSWSLPLFYHYDKNLKITFIANGIGDTDKDYVLKTDIVNSVVSFSGINISRQSKELLDIKNYGIQYWMDNSKM